MNQFYTFEWTSGVIPRPIEEEINERRGRRIPLIAPFIGEPFKRHRVKVDLNEVKGYHQETIMPDGKTTTIIILKLKLNGNTLDIFVDATQESIIDAFDQAWTAWKLGKTSSWQAETEEALFDG